MAFDRRETSPFTWASIVGAAGNGVVILIASREWFLPNGSSYRDMLGAGLMAVTALIAMAGLPLIFFGLTQCKFSRRSILPAVMALTLCLSPLFTGFFVSYCIDVMHHLTPEP